MVNAGEEWNVYTYEMRQVGGTRAVVNLDPYGPECQAPLWHCGSLASWHPAPPPPTPPDYYYGILSRWTQCHNAKAGGMATCPWRALAGSRGVCVGGRSKRYASKPIFSIDGAGLQARQKEHGYE